MTDDGYAPGWNAMLARDARRRELWDFGVIVAVLTHHDVKVGPDRVVFSPKVNKIVVNCYDYVIQDQQ